MSADSQSSTLRSISKESPECKDGNSEVFVPPTMDTGRDAWMTIAGVWLVQFCTYGYVSAFGVYQDFYTHNFLPLTSPSNISWIGSFQLFFQYAPGIFIGRAFDAGYFRHMTIVGSILQVASMSMLSMAHEGQYYEVFLTQALGMGLGQSLLFLPSITVIGHHFKHRRAMATGIAVSGASIGGIVWPAVLDQLFLRNSFALGVRVTAAITGLLLILANFLMKPRSLPCVHQLEASKLAYIRIIRDGPYLISIGAAFLVNLGLFFPYFYLQLYATSQGFGNRLSFYVITIINAGSFFGRILPNLLADASGSYNLLIPCLIITSALVFSIFGVQTFAGASIFGFLYGFWSGSYVSLIPTLLAQMSTQTHDQGTRMGVAFSIVGLALLVGTPIEGTLVRIGDGPYVWHRAIIFCGVMVLGGALGMTLSRHVFVRQGRGGERGFRV